MHTEKREDPLPDMGYEVRDINLKAIGKATLWFFAFAGISAAIGAVLFYYMNPGAHKAPATAMIRQPLDQNVPLVQGNIHAKTDIAYLRQHEEAALYGAPKLNKDGKSYTIPIAAAMEMVARSGGKIRASGGSASPGGQEKLSTGVSRTDGPEGAAHTEPTTTPTLGAGEATTTTGGH